MKTVVFIMMPCLILYLLFLWTTFQIQEQNKFIKLQSSRPVMEIDFTCPAMFFSFMEQSKGKDIYLITWQIFL